MAETVFKKFDNVKVSDIEFKMSKPNFTIDTLKEFKDGDKVIFDRCPLDNLVYSMWAMSQEGNDIDEDFIDECIPIVRDALSNIDIIFFIPMTKNCLKSILKLLTKSYLPKIQTIHADFKLWTTHR